MPALGAQANLHLHGPDELWLLIDDESATLHVYRGEREVERFFPISLGQRGAAPLRVRGDKQTPTGEFRINRFNFKSRFHIFLGLNYPTPWHALDALNAGIMSQQEYEDYFAYLRRYGRPPQDTVLGGDIGIHGIGKGDPSIHERFHWTEGCIAVTNEQIERLAGLVEVGTRVVIR
ncbi:L,D-transpeptidase family protein [Litchfieldella qijiaojingensis]|nr:L,D-transpeptidase [Halomonas qijiaojingensis]